MILPEVQVENPFSDAESIQASTEGWMSSHPIKNLVFYIRELELLFHCAKRSLRSSASQKQMYRPPSSEVLKHRFWRYLKKSGPPLCYQSFNGK